MDPKDLGYYFHPRLHPNDPGFPALEINVVAEPSHQHFDVKEVHVPVSDAFDDVQMLKIRHPKFSSTYHVCLGHLELIDFAGKSLCVFSFGGELRVVNQGDRTVCNLTSGAPIIWLDATEDVNTLLGQEFESIFARLRAAWLGREAEFRKRLSNADALTLYIAFLNDILTRIGHNMRAARTDDIHRACEAAIEILRADGLWPRYPPGLTDALSPGRPPG